MVYVAKYIQATFISTFMSNFKRRPEFSDGETKKMNENVLSDQEKMLYYFVILPARRMDWLISAGMLLRCLSMSNDDMLFNNYILSKCDIFRH